MRQVHWALVNMGLGTLWTAVAWWLVGIPAHPLDNLFAAAGIYFILAGVVGVASIVWGIIRAKSVHELSVHEEDAA